MADRRRNIPSVDQIVRGLEPLDIPRPAVVELVRRELARLRGERTLLTFDDALNVARSALDDLRLCRIQPVINGTGVLIHTNFGRAPLGEAVIATVGEVGRNYNNLEYDLTGGRRGGRAAYLEHNLAVLCHAQAATVVNNNAAALVLILHHFTRGPRKQVVISRGELIQIGGGFRIPEILEASGAQLCEVGTTNKTNLNDYARALGKETAMILKVHRSNFYMNGFVQSPSTRELAELARKKRVVLVEDLGSGATFLTEQFAGLEHEPTPAQVLADGVDLVCFSGDKLLSGPQAGIIAGKAKLVAALKRQPLFRALRCDKLILAGLQTTVDLHLSDSQPIPVIQMMQMNLDCLATRAQTFRDATRNLTVTVEIGKGKSQVGGGALPRSSVASVTLDLHAVGFTADQLATRLRQSQPPVIGYIASGRFKIDLRTVFPQQDEQLLRAIRSAVGKAV